MTLVRKLAFAALLTATMVTPAFAEWQDAGQVRFDRDMSRDSVDGLDRPVRALSFTARRSDIFCDNIRAVLESGRRVDVFSGVLRLDAPTRADLPGDSHVIQRIEFRCRAERRHGRVEIAADTVARDWRDRDDRRGSRWDASGGVVRPDNWGRWRNVATETFMGRRDRESSDAGWAGQRVEAVALRPIDDDASCRRVVVQFGNGNSKELNIGRYDVLRHGLFYVLDLPGDARTVVRVGMACRAIADRDVRIEIWLKQKR